MATERVAIERLAIVGLGLIGGSIGMAATRSGLVTTVAGFDVDPSATERAFKREAISEPCDSLQHAVAGASVVFVACPVSAVTEAVDAVLSHVGDDVVVTDVGSVKQLVVDSCTDPRFVGGHPIAGSETAGIDHARADLFEGAPWYLTPVGQTAGIGLERLMRFLTAIGAKPCAIEADVHDRLMADVSHMPHVIANVMVAQAAQALAQEGERLPALGPSFRDATRVAGANSGFWPDIYIANRDSLIPELDALIDRIVAARDLIASGDRSAIVEWNDHAAALRARLLDADLAGGEVHELRVSVPNKPGLIGQLALALGRSGVNIVDMALYPAPDMQSGAVSIWVSGEGSAEKAAAAFSELDFPVTQA